MHMNSGDSSVLRRGAAILAVLVLAALEAKPASPPHPLPYRFLVVISDQWKDPASYLIEAGGEFPIIVGLLKNWGLPFTAPVALT